MDFARLGFVDRLAAGVTDFVRLSFPNRLADGVADIFGTRFVDRLANGVVTGSYFRFPDRLADGVLALTAGRLGDVLHAVDGFVFDYRAADRLVAGVVLLFVDDLLAGLHDRVAVLRAPA